MKPPASVSASRFRKRDAVDTALPHFAGHAAERSVGRLLRPVRPEQPGLPSDQTPFVGEQEVEERGDVRLAVREAHGVDELLGVQRVRPDGSRALDAAVERALRGRDRRLEAVLEVPDARAAADRRLVRAREGVFVGGDELVVVALPDRAGVRVPRERALEREVAVGVVADVVEQRPCPPHAAVRLAEPADEEAGGVARVRRRVRVVVAARRGVRHQVQARAERLERVVAVREQERVVARRDADARLELRLPEVVRVDLVPDRHVVDRGVARERVTDERAELGALGGASRASRAGPGDRQHEPHREGAADDAVHRHDVGARQLGAPAPPGQRHAERADPEVTERGRRRGRVSRPLQLVVDDPDDEVGVRPGDGREDEREQDRAEEAPHPPVYRQISALA